MKSSLLCVGFALLQAVLVCTLSDSDDSEDSNYERSRRGWSMMRLGRGLQMLRLGKRTSLPFQHHDNSLHGLTPAQMQAVLVAMLDEEREEFRRQPPLPRYGRELDFELESAGNLYPVYQDTDGPSDLSPAGDGRFKRSVEDGEQKQLSDDTDQAMGRLRAVALPRIGRYLGRLYKWRPTKAVPAPRIGREN